MPKTRGDEISSIVERWERTGVITPGNLRTIEDLRQSDPDMFRRLSPIIPLMRVDAGIPRATAHRSDDIDVVDAVMGRVEAEEHEGRKANSRRRLMPLAAAAATVLVVGASLLSIFFLQSEPSREVTIVVRFELSAPEADSVALVGDFNDWESSEYRMKDRDNDGTWEIEVELERGRVYTYNFLIDDDRWIADPSAETRVEDAFGGQKSILNL